ncbi:MAG: transglycosylase SLT domain-containing protein [Ktedonobacterales bacterium]
MHLSTLRLHRAPLTSRAMRFSMLLFGVLGLTLIASQLASAATAEAAGMLRYQRGYSVQGSWLCYGWSNGAYHCTQHWHRSGGRLISDNRAWVPNYGTAAAAPAAHKAAPVVHNAPIVRNAPVARKAAPARNTAAAPVASSGSVQNQIRAVFGPYAGQALNIARCESGFNPSAVNRSSDAEGVFQFLASTWRGTSYAGYSRMNASANIHAAYQIFVRDGHSWREWQCKP